jgi:hypothetical protein
LSRGQAGLAGTLAVPDQIHTAAGHQCRGLGSVVMRTLQREALAAGAYRAVLSATTDGRSL